MRAVCEVAERLDRLLVRQWPSHSRSRWARAIAEGQVRVDGKLAKSGQVVKPGQVVEVESLEDRPAHDLTPASQNLTVVFEDRWLMVIDKPRGLAVHPAATLKEPSLVNVLLGRGGGLSQGSSEYRPGIVHRLDKDTTGLIVVAKDDRTHEALAAQFAGKLAVRRYVCVAAGDIARERITVDAPLARDRRNRLLMAVDPAGKPAITHFLRLGRLDKGTLLAARLETGRTHQIRAHLRAIGHPALGDRLYATGPLRTGPLQLHAVRLSFVHPSTRAKVEFFAPPPADFQGAEFVDAAAVDRV